MEEPLTTKEVNEILTEIDFSLSNCQIDLLGINVDTYEYEPQQNGKAAKQKFDGTAIISTGINPTKRT